MAFWERQNYINRKSVVVGGWKKEGLIIKGTQKLLEVNNYSIS